MGNVKIAYYVVIKGRGYWRPTPKMKALGFADVSCGPDGPAAWTIAETWARRWQAVRCGEQAAPADAATLSREQAEAARRWPPRSVGAGFQAFIRTGEWSGLALSTRTKIWWPAWFRIREHWGDVDPDTITFAMMSEWRAGLAARHGTGVAHRTLKVWRALWTVMTAMRIAHGADPSKGIRNRAPPPRHQTWTHDEARRLVKTAWRMGYRGLACVIAVSWDTMFSPVDVRTLRERNRIHDDAGRLVFDRTREGRAKTGRAAIGTVSHKTARIVAAYLRGNGRPGDVTARLPDAFLFRTRSGGPYRDDTLADDFAAVRAAAFPGDSRRLMDMRRSGAVEAVAGDASPTGLAAKMANSIDRSNTLHKTYAPVSLDAVRGVDEARLRGRAKATRTAPERNKRG
jgi:hypothetical protein